jgi:hypothetical protein
MLKRLIFITIVYVFIVNPALGNMTVFTDEATFTAQLLPGYYLENFNSYNKYAFLGYNPIEFGPVNNWEYAISSSTGLYAVQAGAGSISTLYGDDTLTVTFTGKPVMAVGGLFFGTDYNGAIVPAKISLSLSDGTVEEYTYTNINDAFRGFVSSIAISSLTINVPGADHENGPYPTMDHFYVGVPVPAALILGMLGLSTAGIKLRKYA